MPAELTTATLHAIHAELARINTQWPHQDHPDHGTTLPDRMEWFRSETTRWQHINDQRKADGTTAWDGVLLEEALEAITADKDKRRAELVQVIATACAWLSCLDRREAADELISAPYGVPAPKPEDPATDPALRRAVASLFSADTKATDGA